MASDAPIPKGLKDFVRQEIQEGDAAALAAKTYRNALSKTRVFRRSIEVFQNFFQQFLMIIAILLVVFIIHQSKRKHNACRCLKLWIELTASLRHRSIHLDRPGSGDGVRPRRAGL